MRLLEEMEKKDKKKRKQLNDQSSRTFSSNFDAALWAVGSVSNSGFMDRQDSTGSLNGSVSASVAAQNNVYEDDDDVSGV